jgi:aspartyl-tRNA(Asn)/glutamyl-tRNA(Gln) amidotransferase subunit B
MNSFAMVEEAIQAEITRQAEILDDGGEVVQATMAYDPVKRRTRVLRLKENADDYRYFDDPDLLPLVIEEEQVQRVRAAMPELPDAMRDRFQQEHGLSRHVAEGLTANAATGAFYDEGASKCPNRKLLANWILRDVTAIANDRGVEVSDLGIEPRALAANVALVDSGRITPRSGQQIIHILAQEGGDPEEIMKARGLEAVQDTALIEGAVDEILAANPKSIETFREGDKKVMNFLMGQVMKRTQGKANPAQVKQLLEKKLRG